MFLEMQVLSMIEHLKEVQKDIAAFEDPLVKSTSAGRRARAKAITVEKELKEFRKKIMAIRHQRVLTGEKKTL